MFDVIKTYSEWDERNYGYCQRLTEEANNVQITIDNAISGNLTLSDQGKAIVTTALHIMRTFIDLFIRYVDTTYKELRLSKHTEKKGLASCNSFRLPDLHRCLCPSSWEIRDNAV